jgi:hypothetical protein
VHGKIELMHQRYTITESVQVLSITLNRSIAFRGEVTAQISTRDGTAKAGEDFTPLNGAYVGWRDGQGGPKNISLTILQDDIPEQDENFTVHVHTNVVVIMNQQLNLLDDWIMI